MNMFHQDLLLEYYLFDNIVSIQIMLPPSCVIVVSETKSVLIPDNEEPSPLKDEPVIVPDAVIVPVVFMFLYQ